MRVVGLDAPENFRPQCDEKRERGLEAKARLVELMRGGWSIDRMGRDRYGRTLAWVFVDGRNIASIMAAKGHARPYFRGRRRSCC